LRFDTKPVTGEVMMVLPSVIFSSSRRAFDCAFCARQVQLCECRLIGRLVVVERLAGEELPFEQALRAIEVGLRALQVGFALADRRRRHVFGCDRLFHLFLNVEVLELRNPLAPAHPVTKLDGDGLEPSGGARHDRDGRFANQVADNGDLLRDRALAG